MMLNGWSAWELLVIAFGFAAAVSCKAGPRVIITSGGGREFPVRVEIADTPAKRELGLQYRHELAEDRGMLFLFPEDRNLTFWMKNTPVSLDLIFIDHERKIVGIVHDAVPFSTDSLSVSAPSRFVLEISGGLSRRRGIKLGDAVRFEGIAPDRVRE